MVRLSRDMAAKALAIAGQDLHAAVFGLWVNSIAGSALVPRPLRVLLLRAAGIRVGRAQIAPSVVFTNGNVVIGQRSMINIGAVFQGAGRITLGAQVAVGPGVMFCTSDHGFGPPERRVGAVVERPITVGDGCWLGARAVVLPGVTVGPGCVIAAGAVVAHDCEPDGLYAGVPARLIRTVTDRARGPVATD